MEDCYPQFDQCLKTVPDPKPISSSGVIDSFVYYYKKRRYDQKLINQQKAGHIIDINMTPTKCWYTYETCLHVQSKMSLRKLSLEALN